MMLNTSGIVLSTLRYSDSAVIAKIYTRKRGLRSFMVRVGKGKTAAGKMNTLQPLSLISVSFRDDDRKNLHTARSIERETSLRTIPFEPAKTCIALFIAELVGRAIAEEEENDELYKFLESSILLLDDTEKPTNFHLKFMVEFTRFLGFYPQENTRDDQWFDLTEGEFVPSEPIHPYLLPKELTTNLSELLNAGMTTFDSVRMSNKQRRELLQKLIDYYRLHLDGMKEIRSHKVLEEVLA